MIFLILALQASEPTAPAPPSVTVNTRVGHEATGATGTFGIEDLLIPGLHSLRARGALQRKVGGLMAAGKCDDAKTEALKGGDLQLAQQVKDLCTTKPQQ